jgi:hypothetical protein
MCLVLVVNPRAPARRELARPARAQSRHKALRLSNGLACERCTSMAIKTASIEKPGAVSRPGATRQFQFHE